MMLFLQFFCGGVFWKNEACCKNLCKSKTYCCLWQVCMLKIEFYLRSWSSSGLVQLAILTSSEDLSKLSFTKIKKALQNGMLLIKIIWSMRFMLLFLLLQHLAQLSWQHVKFLLDKLLYYQHVIICSFRFVKKLHIICFQFLIQKHLLQ